MGKFSIAHMFLTLQRFMGATIPGRQRFRDIVTKLMIRQFELKKFYIPLFIYIALLWRSTFKTSQHLGDNYWHNLYKSTGSWKFLVAAHVVLWRYLLAKASDGAEAIQNVTYKAASVPLDFVGKQSAVLQQRIQHQIEGFLDSQMDQMGDKVKSIVKDPYMPVSIRASVDDFVDVLMPDLKLALFNKTHEYINYRSTVKKKPPDLHRRRASSRRRGSSAVIPLDLGKSSLMSRRGSDKSPSSPDEIESTLNALDDSDKSEYDSDESDCDSDDNVVAVFMKLRFNPNLRTCTLRLPNKQTVIEHFKSVRSWVLYTLSPFDRTVWRNLRNRNYLLLQMIGLIPGSWVPGVGMVWWLFVFILHDKKDEFQLSQFIVGFQTAKFFSQGIFSLLRGAFLFYLCSTVRVPSNCETAGPQARHYIDFLFFLVQISLVWYSFYMLPHSEPCMAVHDPDDVYLLDDSRSDRRQIALRARVRLGSGGRLNYLLWWHSVTVLLIIALGIIAYFWYQQFGWQFRTTCYWLETFYGLTAMPFVPFKIPVMGSLLTPTKATGYTRDGVTVIRVIPPPPTILAEKLLKIETRRMQSMASKFDIEPVSASDAQTPMMRDGGGRRFFMTDEYEERLRGTPKSGYSSRSVSPRSRNVSPLNRAKPLQQTS